MCEQNMKGDMMFLKILCYTSHLPIPKALPPLDSECRSVYTVIYVMAFRSGFVRETVVSLFPDSFNGILKY